VATTPLGVFQFAHDHGVPARELVSLLGGKGAGLAEMTAALGMNVPPGFTISVPVCRAWRQSGWPNGLDDEIDKHVRLLGEQMGRTFGDPEDPLLLAVRSGAPVSMPGMLDTVLNLGLTDKTVEGLARASSDPVFAWDSYRRFVTMFAATVMGVGRSLLDVGPAARDEEGLRQQVRTLRERIVRAAGRDLPQDPWQQLREAVEAVFSSWNSDRARAYRAKEGIADDLGTAVNVQSMVFGNRGPRSGTGVVFTRNPSTGEPEPYGDYLVCAQGEDVVSGSANTMPVAELRNHQPQVYEELVDALRRLEIHYRDMCDVEFTVEEGRLYLLQTRVGKRSAVAAVRIAVDMVSDPDIALSKAEALQRVSREQREAARTEITNRVRTADDAMPLATGLGASPGRATGRVVFSAEAAADTDDDVILVRRETSPEDVAGMAASVGILTTRGGLVSHAAVVARGWGIPAVVGAADLELGHDEFRTGAGEVVRAGDVITIDGGTGQVWRGRPESSAAGTNDAEELPQLAQLEEWARQAESTQQGRELVG